jgi:hypothetical protein
VSTPPKISVTQLEPLFPLPIASRDNNMVQEKKTKKNKTFQKMRNNQQLMNHENFMSPLPSTKYQRKGLNASYRLLPNVSRFFLKNSQCDDRKEDFRTLNDKLIEIEG